MRIQSAMVLVRMALLFFLAGSPFVPLLAGLYPAQVAPIVLVGAIAIAVPPGIVLAHALQRHREDELAEKYRRSERFYILAAVASQVGVVMANLGRGTVGTLGIVVSASGMLAAIWLLVKASPAGGIRDAHSPAPMDQGRLD